MKSIYDDYDDADRLNKKNYYITQSNIIVNVHVTNICYNVYFKNELIKTFNSRSDAEKFMKQYTDVCDEYAKKLSDIFHEENFDIEMFGYIIK